MDESSAENEKDLAKMCGNLSNDNFIEVEQADFNK